MFMRKIHLIVEKRDIVVVSNSSGRKMSLLVHTEDLLESGAWINTPHTLRFLGIRDSFFVLFVHMTDLVSKADCDRNSELHRNSIVDIVELDVLRDETHNIHLYNVHIHMCEFIEWSVFFNVCSYIAHNTRYMYCTLSDSYMTCTCTCHHGQKMHVPL